MKTKTPEDLILPVVMRPEDRGKIIVSRYYRVTPESHHLGIPLSPHYHECNLRIDWGVDGGIYRVAWKNMERK